MWVCICAHINTCVCIYIYICMDGCLGILLDIQAYKVVCRHTCIHLCMYGDEGISEYI